MNCLECSDYLQRTLDGETAPVEVEAHLASCKNCHDQYSLARQLLFGLSHLARPLPRSGLADVIVRSSLRDRARRRTRRWLIGATAAAAMILVAVGVLRLPRDQPERLEVAAQPTAPAQQSLQDNVQEAGQALAELTRRTAADTLESSRTYLPAVDFNNAADPQVTMPDVPAEPLRAWNDAVGGVSVGLEPLAASAMHAASFFRREVPLLGSEPGSER